MLHLEDPDESIKKMDEYEGSEYERVTVNVFVDELHPSEQADVYVFVNPPDPATMQDWSLEEFNEEWERRHSIQ